MLKEERKRILDDLGRLNFFEGVCLVKYSENRAVSILFLPKCFKKEKSCFPFQLSRRGKEKKRKEKRKVEKNGYQAYKKERF